MSTRVLIGTASWQEPDFIKHWYPKGLSKSNLLSYYAQHFSYVEVNGTFYGIPQAKTTAQWCAQTPDDFVFDIKLHRLLSRHTTEAKFLPPELRNKAEIANGKVELNAKMEKLVAKKFLTALQPLIEAKKMGALLLQLSPSFRPATHSLTELDNVLGIFADFCMAVELRNRFWLEAPQREATVQFFKERKTTLVSVDAPPASHHFTVMPNLDFCTNSRLGYFRLHGRNEEAYVKGRTVQERFDYEYSEEELIEFAQRVTGMCDQTEAVHVVFNNNREDLAPKAASQLMKIMERLRRDLEVARPRKIQEELL
jgi:uncharacterized protein YecE (DUF72 family)